MPDFPTSKQLSEFECPPENPLYEGGHWAQTSPNFYPMQKISSGGDCVASDSVHDGPNYSHWAPERFTSDNGYVEAWICASGGQLGASLETWRVALWSQVGANFSGYLVYFGGGLSKGTVTRRYTNGSFIDIAGGGGGYPSVLGIAIRGTPPNQYIEAWNDGVLESSVLDNNYSGFFWAGISVEDPTGGGLSIPCFGAGVPSRTQFFRWLYN